MSQYTVTTRVDGVDTDTQGPFYIESKANTVAQRESRKNTSATVLVVVDCEPRRRGYPRAYRMGRLHKP